MVIKPPALRTLLIKSNLEAMVEIEPGSFTVPSLTDSVSRLGLA
jgi:hypothetical protein